MQNLKNLREKAKLTQLDLADKLHVDRTSVSKWEIGAAKPRADLLLPLAEVLQCTVDELLRESAS